MGSEMCIRDSNIAAPGVIQMGALLDGAGLAWSPREAPEGVIAEVALCTKQLERYVSFAPEDSTVAGLVAQWQHYQVQRKDPE